MKILLLSPLPPPVGGIATWSVNIIDYYRHNKNTEIIHLNTAIKFRSITSMHLFSRLISGVVSFAKTAFIFVKFIRFHNPEVAHLTSSGSLGLFKDYFLCIIARVYKKPVVMHFRFGRIPEICEAKNWEWKLFKRVVFLSEHIIVLDELSRSALMKLGFENVSVVPNPVAKDVEDFLSTLEKVEYPDFDPEVRILFVGHVIRTKGVFDLVRACSQLSVVKELVLVGPYENEVKRELLRLASGAHFNIIFLGVMSKDDVFHEMRKATMLVLPSYSEGFPNVIIEAMAMKCAVIASDVGAVANILDTESLNPAGITFPPRNIDALKNAIFSVATDEVKAKTIKANAFFKVKNNYVLSKVCASYEKIWNISCRQKE